MIISCFNQVPPKSKDHIQKMAFHNLLLIKFVSLAIDYVSYVANRVEIDFFKNKINF